MVLHFCIAAEMSAVAIEPINNVTKSIVWLSMNWIKSLATEEQLFMTFPGCVGWELTMRFPIYYGHAVYQF